MQSCSCMGNFTTHKCTPLYVTAQIVLYCCMEIISRIDIIECHVMTLWTRAFIVFKGTVGYFHGTKQEEAKTFSLVAWINLHFMNEREVFCCCLFNFLAHLYVGKEVWCFNFGVLVVFITFNFFYRIWDA